MEMKPDGALAEATGNMPSSMAEAGAGGLPSLKSPIPYLFGGLAIILTLISFALLILACSHRKHSSSSSSQERESKTVDVDGVVNSEPNIVVIMAGDTNPTFLAKPLPSTSTTHPTHQSV
ncbi:protein GLUTAMINE DUMPER 5-like [Prosopis cineraria]|uniref:protein GLUTAMINE DUMPER 5-like n=1 Tax=Prosopis cineraria TaxID=364024 RepID=UPI002410A391|nr:protein GLUTAMINE DUMPER 5-like [Prosopis cineraria]